MRYVLAVDGSEDALKAAGFLSGLNLGEADEIHVLHVVEELWGIHKAFKDFERIRRVREEFADRIVREAEDTLARFGARIRTAVVEGAPENVIVEYGTEANADLVLMGATGVAGAAAVRLGGTARHVVTTAPWPVLVGRGPVSRQREGRLTIVFGTDGSDCSNKAVAVMRSLPFFPETRVVVVHAVDSVMRIMPERFSLELDDSVKDAIAEARTLELADAETLVARDAEVLRESFPGVETRIPLGEPTTELIREADRLSADLIAVGCRGVRGLQEMLGSVSRRILSKAPCSVLVSKMPG